MKYSYLLEQGRASVEFERLLHDLGELVSVPEAGDEGAPPAARAGARQRGPAVELTMNLREVLKALAGAFSRRCKTLQRFAGSSNPQWRHCSVSGLEWCLVSLCPAPVLPFLSTLLALASPASALQDSVVLGAGTTGHPMLVTEALLRPRYTAARNWWWPPGK